MQAKKRYFWVTVSLVVLCLVYYVGLLSRGDKRGDGSVLSDRAYVTEEEYGQEQDIHYSPRQRGMRGREHGLPVMPRCRMETCFNFSKCTKEFKVYVYPQQEQISTKYQEILTAIQNSRYYTKDPNEACLFVPSIDTLDRDKRSKDYVRNVNRIENLQHWNGGQNHIVFNLYYGTWPDYDEADLGFDPGKAILAKASLSDAHNRPGFDISFPLFHQEHTFKGGEPGQLVANNVPPVREYTLVFKGKRYLTGIGSETRNSLYHIHNNQDIILLTTCKHGKGWENVVDERCEKDNQEYDKWDYKMMLQKSTFCLVPRGRRLGSYRFLEALQAACIPVLLSNNWVLPFSEVINWNKAIVWGDERLLLQIPSIVRSVSHSDILAMRQQTQFLWNTYFSSIDNIVTTTLEIIKDRVSHHMSHSGFMWNTHPGALQVLPEFSLSLTDYPFYVGQLGTDTGNMFTALIYARSSAVMLSSPIYRLVKNIGRSTRLAKIVILWHCDSPPPVELRWPVSVSIPVVHKVIKSVVERFMTYSEITTDAILSVDEENVLITDEIEFAFHVWKNFPDRLVGYQCRNHHWDNTRNQWAYTSKWTNDYSMVLTTGAFYHRYYSHMLSHWMFVEGLAVINQSSACEHILMNFLVSHVTRLPPIKLANHRQLGVVQTPGGSEYSQIPPRSNISLDKYIARQNCMNAFVKIFGYMPLVRTSVRFDPLLFKDPVSRKKKKVPTATLR